MQRTLVATGPVDPGEAWERYADTGRWSSWAPQIRLVTPHTRISPGLRGRVDLAVCFEVTAVDEVARSWSWRVWLPPMGRLEVALTHTVGPDPAGTRTTLTMTAPAPVVLAYQPLAAFALHQLVRA